MAAVLLFNIKTAFVLFLFFLGRVSVVFGDPCASACHCLGSMVDCSDKGLIDVPKDLPKWVTMLDLQNNALKNINPTHFTSLSKLETLSLSNNQISFINTTVFMQIPNLKTLTLNYNKFTEIPTFNKNSALTQLSINHNRIHSVDGEALHGATKLRTLDLSYNHITDISAGAFPADNSLLHVLLNNNKLVSIQAGALANLTTLETLRLSKNKISRLPKNTFASLKRLKILEMNRNKFKFIEGLMFHGLENLQVLKLHKNQISALGDGALWGLARIHTLNLDYNNITNVLKKWLYGLDTLEQLSLSHNKITSIQTWEFCKLLTELDLSHNVLTTLSKEAFNDLHVLQTLRLDYNRITHIADEAFLGLANLHQLSLSHNHVFWTVEDSNGAFLGLSSLKQLNLNNNQIKSLAKVALTGLDKLEVIDLSSNNITTVQENVFSAMTDLKEIKFNSSNLLCDCSLSWLPIWLKGSGFQATVKGACAHPEWIKGKSVFNIDRDDFKCKDFPKPMITQEPKGRIALKGQNVSLECEAVSSEAFKVTYQWRKNDRILTNANVRSEDVQFEDIYKYNSRLYLTNVRDSDAASYQCIVTNKFGSAYSKRVNIVVHVFPRFIKKPMDINVKAGKHARLECAAIGSPPPVISWKKDGGVNFPAARERRITVIPNDHVFFIVTTKIVDEGVYSCMASNAAGTVVANASITVSEVAKIVRDMENKVSRIGKTTVLECMSGGNPKPRVRWLKDHAPLSVTARHFFTANDQLLVIIRTAMSDAGRYQCEVSNALGADSDSAVLTVVDTGALIAGVSPHPDGGQGLLGIKEPLRTSHTPGDGSDPSERSDSTTTEITIIAVVCCVVGTSLVWVIIIYQTRIKHDDYTSTPTDETNLPVDGGTQNSSCNSSQKDANYTTSSSQYMLAGYLYPDHHHSKESGYDSSEGRRYLADYQLRRQPTGVTTRAEMQQYTPLIAEGSLLQCHDRGEPYSGSNSGSVESSLSTGSTQLSGGGGTLRTFRPYPPSTQSPTAAPPPVLRKYSSASVLGARNSLDRERRVTPHEFRYSGEPPDDRDDIHNDSPSPGCTIYMNHRYDNELPSQNDAVTQPVSGVGQEHGLQRHKHILTDLHPLYTNPSQTHALIHNPCASKNLYDVCMQNLYSADDAKPVQATCVRNPYVSTESRSQKPVPRNPERLDNFPANCVRNPLHSITHNPSSPKPPSPYTLQNPSCYANPVDNAQSRENTNPSQSSPSHRKHELSRSMSPRPSARTSHIPTAQTHRQVSPKSSRVSLANFPSSPADV